MKILPIDEIISYKQELNIFEPLSPVPEMMLKNKLYPGLPLCGEEVLWGFNILKKAQEMGIKELDCRPFPEMDRKEKLKLALTMENKGGKYSWEEKRRILQYLAPEEIDRETLILMEGNDDPRHRIYHRTFFTLPRALQELITRQIINLKTAEEIKDLPEELFSHFLENLDNLRLSFSTRRLFLTNLFEISRRDRLTPGEILALYDRLINSAAPLEASQTARYPRLTQMRVKLENFRKDNLKGTGIELKAPENFEGDRFTLTFSFTSRNLEKKLKALETIKDKQDELFELL